MTSQEIRKKYLEFFESRAHKVIAPAKLVLEDDPTTLFTSSGMQPLVPYLMGQEHLEGKRLVDSQPSFRSEDMDEVGDNRHTTFFEMLGNWSLGDYFKEEQIGWFFEFLTKDLSLEVNRLHVTVFQGNDLIPKDGESFNKWKELGIPEERIYLSGVEDNWWSRSGPPEKMPVGEIGGIDSEVFYEFPDVEHDSKYGEKCHPHCDCGHFLEIGNSVFIQYKKVGEGKFEELPQKNVDFGGGLERLTAAANNENDIFRGDLHLPIIEKVCEQLGVEYGGDPKVTANLRVIADHIKASTFLIKSGVVPANKLQGYILRRLLRRAGVKINQIKPGSMEVLPKLVDPVIDIYQGTDYFHTGDWDEIRRVVEEEINRFQQTLSKGLKEIEKLGNQEINGKVAFNLYQSYGFPSELTEELLRERGLVFGKAQFDEEFKKHQEASRTASQGIFKGGLAGHSEVETKYHTATHLLHQALRDVLGPEVFQKGSNINPERLRFDFSFNRKMTEEEVRRTEEIINQRIKEDLKVDNMMMSVEEAQEKNAIGLFTDKYAKEVSIYGVGPGFELDPESKDQRLRANYYSLEFCGGPHVEHTGVIGGIKIEKEEAVSQGVRRIRAVLA
jgi:alanyl-tRNA synthetase